MSSSGYRGWSEPSKLVWMRHCERGKSETDVQSRSGLQQERRVKSQRESKGLN